MKFGQILFGTAKSTKLSCLVPHHIQGNFQLFDLKPSFWRGWLGLTPHALPFSLLETLGRCTKKSFCVSERATCALIFGSLQTGSRQNGEPNRDQTILQLSLFVASPLLSGCPSFESWCQIAWLPSCICAHSRCEHPMLYCIWCPCISRSLFLSWKPSATIPRCRQLLQLSA